MKKKMLAVLAALSVLLLLAGCASIPKKATAVKNFRVSRYLGTWYEIARIDNEYEEDLDNVTATYILATGGLKIVNEGYDVRTGSWKVAEGKASFRGDSSVGELKVSFFGPYYAGYNIIALSDDYNYAMVAGESLDYLWILSRDKTIPDEILSTFLSTAEEIGFDTGSLIWVHHD